MTKKVKVKTLPKCDFCECEARYDSPTKGGPWAWFCFLHYWMNVPPDEHGIDVPAPAYELIKE